MARLLINASWIFTHILILRLISSKLNTFKSHIHCESHRYKVDFNWGASKFNWLCLDYMAGDCERALVALLWKFIGLLEAVLSYSELSRFCLFEHDSWWKSGHRTNSQIQVLTDQTYKSVGIGSSRHSSHWILRGHWVSTVHGCVGVSGHLAAWLNRIGLFRFLLWSPSSFDSAWTCRRYCGISKHRSKHNPLSISS